MGMYDYVRSSFPLGEDFSSQCQTKDIEDGYGGTMSQYWISPEGQLYLIDYSHTADFVKIEKDDPEYNEERCWLNFKWVPNGTHGKVRPWIITKYIVIYPENYKGPFESWPEAKLHFRYGKLLDFTVNTKGDYFNGFN